MFSNLLASGLCSVQRCNPVQYDSYVCNARDYKRSYRDKSNIYTSERTEGVTYLISRFDIEAAISHQHWVEDKMEKKKRGDLNLSLRRSMSFAETTLSTCASNDSISSEDSAYFSVFSAATQVTGHTNKYGIPIITPSSSPRRKLNSSPRRKLKNRVNAVPKDRYAASSSIKEKCDWDYTMEVEMQDHIDKTPKPRALSAFVLHLKMRAQMSDFYREEFLLSFPHFPVPKEMDVQSFQRSWDNSKAKSPKRSRDHVPGLVKSTSSMSSMSEQSAAMPPADVPIFLAVDDSSFLDIALSGSLGLCDSRSRKNILPSLDPSKEYLIIGDRQSRKPILVCSLKSRKGKPVVRLFATEPRIPEQEPTIHSDELGITKDRFALYTWAELRTVGEFPDENTKYLLYTSTGAKNKFHKKPLYIACHEHEGSTELNVLRRKEDIETNVSGDNSEAKSDLFHCARVCVRTDSNMSNRNQETNYMMSIVKDVEFANILAMTAIIDELIEFAMRKKCAMQAWKFATMQAD